MSAASQPVTDTTLIDYFRIATFDSITYYKLSATIERKWSQWRPGGWMQYKGRQNADKIFHGMGEQSGRAHCVIHASGSFAHVFYLWFKEQPASVQNAFYCTRVDLQRTQIRPATEYRIRAYKRLSGKKRLIQDDTGITLYIGARTSDTFWRLYDKTEKHLRCEMELKGKQARKVGLALSSGESISGIWNRVLLRSKVPKIYVDYFRSKAEPATLPQLEDVPDYDSKVKWLATLDSLVFKLVNDHEVGERTTTIIARWAGYAALLDNNR